MVANFFKSCEQDEHERKVMTDAPITEIRKILRYSLRVLAAAMIKLFNKVKDSIPMYKTIYIAPSFLPPFLFPIVELVGYPF